MTTKTAETAAQAVARYNKTQTQIERLEARLRTAHDVSRKRYGDMFDALSDGYAIRLDPHGPAYVVKSKERD